MADIIYIAEREIEQLPKDVIEINDNIFVPTIDFHNYGYPSNNCVVWYKDRNKFYVFKLDGDFNVEDMERLFRNAVSRLP